MERGIYFDGWFKHNHCYHPSLPIRTVQMLEDLKRYHGTTLVWSGMGGGSISLPYLEQEINGPVDPRMRFYGGMSDKEFAAECGKLGIRMMGIVFEVQGWEFPAVFDEDGKIAALNLHAEREGHGWYGLREFSQDTYPNAFRTSLKDYYPDGIVNSLGEEVTDLWEECSTRDLHGRPIHAEWVEVKHHKMQAYQMCRNNPVWRGYLKKIIKMQIDAGAGGIQLDECELPMTAIYSGGCFCKDCMREFTGYLTVRRREGKLSDEWKDIDVEHFNYKDYLLENGYDDFPEGVPFFKEYWEYQVCQVRKYFTELAEYARSYALESHGRRIPVSGNFYNLQPAYHPIVPQADIIITEMEHCLFRQPYFYRYSAGFAEGRSVIIAENPYGGIIPELLKLLDRGKGYDLYRVFMLEASVYGCNMSVPYGAWMGNTIKDAFWPPRSVTAQIQDFLYEHEDFFPSSPVKGAAVLYSYASNYWRDAHRSGSANGDASISNESVIDVTATDFGNSSVKMPFWDVIRYMSSKNALYDVLMLPDGELREDGFAPEALDPYPMVVVPDSPVLTKNQQDILLAYAQNGGKVLVYGRLAEGSGLTDRLRALDNVCIVSGISPHGLGAQKDADAKATAPGEAQPDDIAQFESAFDDMYASVSTAICTAPDIGMHRYDSDGRTFVHLLNYAYDREKDRMVSPGEVKVVLKDVAGRSIRIWGLDGEAPATDHDVKKEADGIEVTIRNMGVYKVIEI